MHCTIQAAIIQQYLMFNIHGTVHSWMCILYNQQDATYTLFFIIISALHVSGGFSAIEDKK